MTLTLQMESGNQGNQERVLKLPGGVPVHVFGIFGEDHMFGRAAEYAIYKAERHTGSLNKAIDKAGLAKPTCLRRNSLPASLTEEIFDSVLGDFIQFQTALDPLSCRPPKMVSVVLVQTIVEICIVQAGTGAKELLQTLSVPLPEVHDGCSDICVVDWMICL